MFHKEVEVYYKNVGEYLQPIIMKRYESAQLDQAINDNERRGFKVVQKWEQPKYNRDGSITRLIYCAKMLKND